jgi:PEP-CTERM motif
MKWFIAFLFAVAVSLNAVTAMAAATTTFTDTGSWVDIFYTPSPSSEFLNYDLIVSPTTGMVLDPTRNLAGNAGDFDNVTDGVRDDTWANTVFSSLGAGTPSYVFTKYNPGAPPFTPSDPLPAPGSDPNQLNWSVFDTNTNDTDEFGPYHMARVKYEGTGMIEFLVYDTTTADAGGEQFFFEYGSDANNPENTPPSVDNLFPGDSTSDQHTVATHTTPASYQLQGTDAEDLESALTWSLQGFSGPFQIDGTTPIAGSPQGTPAVSSAGLFTWSPGTSPKGFYFADVRVQDTGGLTGDGVLRVQVPEPCTMALVGLSLIGVFASRRWLS